MQHIFHLKHDLRVCHSCLNVPPTLETHLAKNNIEYDITTTKATPSQIRYLPLFKM